MSTAVLAAVRERPILFSAPMVRAILDGRKTQTRRVMRVQPPDDRYEISRLVETTAKFAHKVEGKLHWIHRAGLRIRDSLDIFFECPYGVPGDRLWVRETWGRCDRNNVIYRADDIEKLARERQWVSWPAWTPSIHMPRWASRITLEIVKVRVERVQDISEQDVCAEGTPGMICGRYQCERCNGVGRNVTWPSGCPHCKGTGNNAQEYYRQLWNSINAKRDHGWDKNPWIWVIEFKRVTGAL